jgi:hypothetical protein
MTAKADLEGGPDADKVRTKLMRDIPKGVKVNRSLLKGAMFDEIEHPIANFNDKKGQPVHAGETVLDPSGNAVKVSSIEMEGREAVLVRTVRTNKKGAEVVKEYKPEQLTAVVTAQVAKSTSETSMDAPDLNENERGLVSKFVDFLRGSREEVSKSVEAPARPQVTESNIREIMNGLELGLRDALTSGDAEERAAALSQVAQEFGTYVSENLSNSEFVTDEPAEASGESTETVETSEDVEKHGVVDMEAEVPPALTPRKKKQTTDSNMEENMEKSTDVEKTRERLVAEAGAFMSELVEAPEAEATELEKEAPEGEETNTLTLDEVALFADRLADRLDLVDGQFAEMSKSLGGKLDNVAELAKSLDITDRITSLEEQIASLKSEVAPAEQVEEVAKRVQELEQQPGHSTQAGEVREAVAKAAHAPLFTRPGGYSIF